MTSTELVSIVLPTYNRANILERCINSILSQTYSNWEFIISDDGSTDETEAVVKRFAKKDSRIRYHRNATQLGLPGNRNAAISIAKGNLILQLEDDIVAEPDCLEILVDTFNQLKDKGEKIGALAPSRPLEYEEDNPSASILDHAVRARNKKRSTPSLRGKFTGLIYSFHYPPDFGDMQEVPEVHPCSLYPRNIFEEAGYYNEKRYHGSYVYGDEDFNIRVKRRGYKFYFQPKAVLHHKMVTAGGCRTRPLNYAYYFVTNHAKFVIGNYRWRALYMIPCSLFFTAFIGLRAVVAYAVTSCFAGGRQQSNS